MSEYLIKGATLTDIADAIREKTGGNAAIAPGNMAAQIRSIVGAPKKCKVTVKVAADIGGPSELAYVVIGDTFYYAEDGAEPVVVEVDPGTGILLNVSSNDPKNWEQCWISINDENVQSGDGAHPYTVTTDMEIMLNVMPYDIDIFYGCIYVTTSETANPVIEALEITKNGTYTAPAGVDGYSPVTVNVETSGGGAPDTCTVVLKHGGDATNEYWCAATRYVDGAFAAYYTYGAAGAVSFPLTITDVVCGSAISIQNFGLVFGDFATTGGVTSTNGSTGDVNLSGMSAVAEVTKTPNVTDEITVTFWLD